LEADAQRLVVLLIFVNELIGGVFDGCGFRELESAGGSVLLLVVKNELGVTALDWRAAGVSGNVPTAGEAQNAGLKRELLVGEVVNEPANWIADEAVDDRENRINGEGQVVSGVEVPIAAQFEVEGAALIGRHGQDGVAGGVGVTNGCIGSEIERRRLTRGLHGELVLVVELPGGVDGGGDSAGPGDGDLVILVGGPRAGGRAAQGDVAGGVERESVAA
jgi:hypothetical protein